MGSTKEFVDKYFNSLPAGYRFRPTDKTLVVDYLKNKVLKQPMPLHRIKTCNIYRYHPYDLCRPDAVARENERFFFTSREKKYPNGARPDRKAGDGFWKATGKDFPISSDDGEVVGFKKTLVYYEGKPKDKSQRKTNWIMHEYRINPAIIPVADVPAGDNNNDNNNILDKCVLAKIYLKPTGSKKPGDTSRSQDDTQRQIMISEQLPPQPQDNPITQPEEYPAAPQVAAPPPYPYHQNPIMEAPAAAYHSYNNNNNVLGLEQLPPPKAQDNPISKPEDYPVAPQVAPPPQYPYHQNPMHEAAAAYHGYNYNMMIPVSEKLQPLPEAQDNPILKNYNIMIPGSEKLQPLPEAQDSPILKNYNMMISGSENLQPLPEAQDNPILKNYNTIILGSEKPQPLPKVQDNPILKPPEEYPMPPQAAALPPFPYHQNPKDEAPAAAFPGYDDCNMMNMDVFGIGNLQTYENCYGINISPFELYQEDNGFWDSQHGGLEDLAGMHFGNNVKPSAKLHGPANNVNHTRKA